VKSYRIYRANLVEGHSPFLSPPPPPRAFSAASGVWAYYYNADWNIAANDWISAFNMYEYNELPSKYAKPWSGCGP
jgi:hypothetical protein